MYQCNSYVKYKSEGGNLVWNKELNKDIPDGWNVKKLGDCCEIILGGTPRTDIRDYWNGNINWLNSGEVAQFPVIQSEVRITEEGLKNSATTLMKEGTVVVSITGNIRVSYLAIESCANQSVVGVSESETLKKSYLFPYLKNMIDDFISLSTGSCQQHINKGVVEDSYILLPKDDIIREFYKITEKIYKQINMRSFENKKSLDFCNLLIE